MIFTILYLFSVMCNEVSNMMNTCLRPNLTSYDCALYKHVPALQYISEIQQILLASYASVSITRVCKF